MAKKSLHVPILVVYATVYLRNGKPVVHVNAWEPKTRACVSKTLPVSRGAVAEIVRALRKAGAGADLAKVCEAVK